MSSVSLQGVARRYGPITALHATDLVVAEGEFLTLLGPSGCGKTTTLRIVAGFVPPSAGRVLFGADDVTRLPPNRRQIGMVFQDYALFPHMTVAENVGFALRERRQPSAQVTARVQELLALIRLDGMDGRLPAQLSGGQQQRVALARAIAFPPRVLLMDEPLSALDLKLRETVQVELRRIQQALGITTIFVTHDQTEAMSLSDTIAVMAQGRIVQRGTPQAIYDHPVNRVVASFVGQVNLLDATVLGEEAGRLVLEAGGVRLHARHPPATPHPAMPHPATPHPASLGVRPHQLAFGAGPNQLCGIVRASTFGGNVWRTTVQVAGAEWTVETHPGHAVPAAGASVVLGWAPEHTMVLRD